MTALYHLFPPTIHPMVIHFTIAIIYLAALAGLAGLIFRRDGFYVRLFLTLLVLAIAATLAAGVAGVISESYDTISPAVAKILSVHKNFGELTGVLVVIATMFQWFAQGKRRVSKLAFLFSLAAVVTVSITGFLGGSMVYNHGLGVH
ncbi:DUF2231 domain-containing protein [Alicyclobacillaceae bacterium I2511]|nr:DUF2231 domain-containing protein [Alicyclobacillaceae bacterium I2511]